MITLSVQDVIDIHDTILATEKGRHGDYGVHVLEGALGRIDAKVYYAGLDDVFDIAAFYIEVIAMGHCFTDANKRTSLVAALTYLEFNNITIPDTPELADLVEARVKKEVSTEDLAQVFASLAILNDE